MALTARFTDNPRDVLTTAGAFLASRPEEHNVILTLLHARVTSPEPGRYWVVDDPAGIGGVSGVVFQSPLDFPATITPMPASAVDAAVQAVCESGVELPGVNGDAGTAARFAGQWTERHKSAAFPLGGQRIYKLGGLRAPTHVKGSLRQAESSDHDTLVKWMDGFKEDTGEGGDSAALVGRRLALGHFFVWDIGSAVSMAMHSVAVENVARIQAVYTPPANRKRGYAAACVAALSEMLVVRGNACVLYTDLGNPTSNSVYRGIGYEAIAEVLRYRFAP